MVKQDRVQLGRIGRAHGVAGAFRVRPYAEDVERFSRLHDVVLTRGPKTLAVTVTEVRAAAGNVIIQTGEITSPEDVRPWVGGELEIDASERIELPEGQYFYDQIIGLSVVTTGGEIVGTVESIIDGPANDVYAVRNGDKEHLIPATEQIVRSIDLGSGQMTIEPIPGLLE